MFEQDYLMRILVSFAEAIRRSMLKAAGEQDPTAAAGLLESAIGDAVDIDGEVLLSLAPESIAGILQISGVDPQLVIYIANSLLLEADYLRQAGDVGLADIRESQARALAQEFEFDLLAEPLSSEEWDELFPREDE